MKNSDRQKIIHALKSDPDIEIISENPDYIEFFDNGAELVFRASLIDPSPGRFDRMLHVLPDAERRTPERSLIIDFLMHLDPAMTAGLSGIYVRAGKRDDRRIWNMDGGYPAEDMILSWDSDYSDRCGWHWRDRGSVVVNMKAIECDSKKLAREIYPERDVAALRENDAGKIAFEQFFITLAHEIRHAAIEFPLTHLYCEIYPDPERNGKACHEDLYDAAGFASAEVLEEDAESWAVAAFEKWRDSPDYGKYAKKAPSSGERMKL